MRPVTTLLALTFAAGFGGFAATACQAAVDSPAQADPLAATTTPAIAALPTAVDGVPVPWLAPLLQRVTPAVVTAHTKQKVRIKNPFANDPMFRRMFPTLPQKRSNQSRGSG